MRNGQIPEEQLVEAVNLLLTQLHRSNPLTSWALQGIHRDTLIRLQDDAQHRKPILFTQERQDMCLDFVAAIEATGGEVPCLTPLQSPGSCQSAPK